MEIKIHYSDVEQLCEQVAGVIKGAASVSYSDSHDWSLRIHSLALRVETGLPSWLVSIARMRHPLLHRNRLARLWDAVPDHEHLSEIIDMPGLRDAEGITDVQREELRRLLVQREFEESLHRHRVAQAWAGEMVPGLEGVTFEEFGLELETAQSADEYLSLLDELSRALGVESDEGHHVPGHRLTEWRAGDHSVVLAIPTGEIGEDEVRAIAEMDALVLLRSRLRPSAQTLLATRPTAARFIRPEVLLEVVAKLAQARSSALDPSEAVERLKQLRVSVLEADGVSLSVDVAAGPPPFEGPAPAFPEGRTVEPPSEEFAD